MKKTPVGGGCISEAWQFEGKNGRYFVKTGNFPFDAEAAGLIAISQAVRTPAPICLGECDGKYWLVLEHVEMGGKVMRYDLLGKDLAKLHRITAETFGWETDNLIGSTPQINEKSAHWVAFWKTRRIGFQFDLARKKGHDFGTGPETLMENLSAFFADYHPRPSLLHGDLWRGNAGFDPSGRPVLFDPAVYFGDREADIAMTELFGGFPEAFIDAYDRDFPLDSGYEKRKHLYNLYHVLNHLNIFGGSYLYQAKSMLDLLLSEAC